MKTYWGTSNDVFDQGYRALRRGIVLFGVFLITLAVLIFMFPALIGFIFASAILFAGVSALVLGYRVWKLKNQARPFEWDENTTDVPLDVDIEKPSYYHKRVTFILR
jgi:hypothetical protein